MVDITKEKEPMGNTERVPVTEASPTVEAPKAPESNLEVASWMEKIEKKFARVPNKTSDVTDDTVIVQQPQPQQPPVTLPVTQQQMQAGKNAKPELGLAWLVTWAIRQLKLLARGGRAAKLREMPVVEPVTQPSEDTKQKQ
jgi:hypothetical protein